MDINKKASVFYSGRCIIFALWKEMPKLSKMIFPLKINHIIEILGLKMTKIHKIIKKANTSWEIPSTVTSSHLNSGYLDTVSSYIIQAISAMTVIIVGTTLKPLHRTQFFSLYFPCKCQTPKSLEMTCFGDLLIGSIS